jgi:hypothetical protein
MRTLAKILRTIGGRSSWPAQDYAAPWGLGPRHHYYFHYYYFRIRGGQLSAADTAAGLVKAYNGRVVEGRSPLRQ